MQDVFENVQMVDKPETVFEERFRERVTVKEVIREIPKRQIVEREKIVEIPEIRKVQRFVEVPKVIPQIYEVPKIETKKVLVEVPRTVVRFVPKIIETDRVEWRERVVRVPYYVDEVRYVEKHEMINIPRYQLREVPIERVKEVEKIRYIPGPIEYINIPNEKLVVYPTPRKIISIKKRHVQQVGNSSGWR